MFICFGVWVLRTSRLVMRRCFVRWFCLLVWLPYRVCFVCDFAVGLVYARNVG